MRRASCTVLLLATLTGCVSAPARHQPVLEIEVPETWTEAASESSATVDERWWDSFGDPNLSAVVDLGLERNHDLRAAAARVEQAEAAARIAGAPLKPQVGVGLNASRQRQNFVGFPIPSSDGSVPSTTASRLGLSFDVSWEIDLWGRLRAGARAALADYQATEADFAGARLSVAGQSAKLWFAIHEARAQVRLAAESVESFRSSAALVRSRFESGIRPSLDLRLALSNLAAAQALLARRERQLDLTERQLEVLVGRYPDRSLVDERIDKTLPRLTAEIPAGLPAEIVSRRPDIVSAERRLVAADQRYLSARRSLYPRLSLTGSGGTVSSQLQDLIDGDFRVWSIVGNLTAPLFQGGRLRADVDRTDAASREAVERYATILLSAYAEIESNLASETYLAERERHLSEAAEQLVAAERLAGERYLQGVEFYLTVLDAQTRAVTARSQLLEVQRQRLDNRVDLFLALGGGFEVTPIEDAQP